MPRSAPPVTSRRTFRTCALALAAALVAGCASPPPPKPARAAAGADYEWFRSYMTWLIQREMKSAGIVGLSIAVVDDQELVWQQGFGWADKDRKVPADAQTVYQAGSISKVFTATAAMQLVEQGRLDLDKPVAGYLPEFRIRNRFPDARPVTLRGLLTHHAGMPSDRFSGFILPATSTAADADAALMRLPGEFGDECLANPPGSSFAYSNLGFSLAGAVVSRVGGAPYAEVLRQSVLAPAGMTGSSFRREDVAARMSKGYARGDEVDVAQIRDLPAGALLTSASDLAQFVRTVFADGRGPAGRVLEPATLAEMLRPQNEASPLDVDFRIGLGWWLDGATEKPFGRMAVHMGNLPPFNAAMVTLPDSKIGVVVLSNSEESAGVIYGIAIDAMRRAVEAKTGVLPELPARAETTLSPEQLEANAGVYASAMGVTRVARSGDVLKTSVAGTAIRLLPREGDRFALQYRLLGLFPLPIEQLEPMSVSFHEVEGRRLQAFRWGPVVLAMGERIAPQPPPSAAWKARLGEYDVVNGGPMPVLGDLELEWDDDKSVMQLRMQVTLVSTTNNALALAPLSDTEAVTLGIGRNSGDLLRCTGPDTCWYSGFELKRRR